MKTIKAPKVERWVLSPHALSRVIERGISALELEQLITAPGFCLRQGPKWIFARHFDERSDNLLAAVLLEKVGENLWVVITVMVHFEEKP